MKNLDIVKNENAAILQKMNDAVKNGDTEGFASAFGDFAAAMQEAVLKDAKELLGVNDAAVLAQRGVRQLTAGEKDYFQKLGEAMKTATPQQAITSINTVLPETEINTIFDYLTENHPLLAAIDFQNTAALQKILMSTSGGVAGWDDLTATIDDELSGSFSVLDLTMMKVSAYIPVASSMLDLGPEWLERWVRTILSEAIAVAAENTFVDGDGNKKPLGMTRALTGAVDNVYPRKATVALNSITPASISAILNTISQAPNGKRRAIPELLMVVNPSDYYTKVMPAVTIRRTDGGWNNDVFPYPTKVVVSAAVPENRAVLGLAKEYFAGLGSGLGGKIEYSDHAKFLEDTRVYKIKMYGNGRPKDANAFVLCDITNLAPTSYQVHVTNAGDFPSCPDQVHVTNAGDFPSYPDARLASLSIGNLTLDPAFNKSIFAYEATTANATNTITAVAKDGEATVAIKVNDADHTGGTAATWTAGVNTVEVTVAKGGETETYTVLVTKSE